MSGKCSGGKIRYEPDSIKSETSLAGGVFPGYVKLRGLLSRVDVNRFSRSSQIYVMGVVIKAEIVEVMDEEVSG